MTDRYDVIVIGIGGMGSATVAHLAARGQNVLGLEQYDIPHTHGSSHGVTRIIRKPQYEDPAYVPLVERAYELWRSLESDSGRDLLHITGGLDIGTKESKVFSEARRSCEEHDIAYDVLDADTVNTRFPGYDVPEDQYAIYQPEGGFVVPEQCIIAHVESAIEHGATISAREPVTAFEATEDESVRVETTKETYEADRLVVTAGAWVPKLIPEIASVAVPERQVLAWLQPNEPALFDQSSFPIFVHEVEGEHFYGFPVYDVPGFKFGKFNHRNEVVDPTQSLTEPTTTDEELLRSYAKTYFPSGAGPTMQLATCMFTNTPDQHFILDRHPEFPQITIGAGFSGHGFKFASVIGEILADLSISGETTHDIGLFSLDRFAEQR